MDPVVVAVDPFAPATAAVRWAADEASRRGVDLRLLTVLDHRLGALPNGERLVPADELEGICEETHQKLLSDVAHDGVEVVAEVVVGEVADQLVVASGGASLLVIGTRGMGQARGLVVGAVGHHLVAHATCPVAVVPDGEVPVVVGVVAGVDGTVGGDDALRWAIDDAARRAVPVEAVMAHDVPSVLLGILTLGDARRPSVRSEARGVALDELEKAVRRVPHPFVDVVPKVIEGRADDVLREQGRQAGLVAVGRRGYQALTAMLLGSTSHRLLRDPVCPVVVVPPEHGAG